MLRGGLRGRKGSGGRRRCAQAAVLILALLSGGCGAPSAQPAAEAQTPYISFTDDTGREVSLFAKPERVAVLFSSLADIWQTAGGETAITVGEAVERGFAGAETPLVDGGAGKTVDVERLIELSPDFVLCSADVAAQTDAAALLEKAGVPCAAFRVEGFADYLRVLEICTNVTGQPEHYTLYGTDQQKKIDGIVAEALARAEQGEGKRILFIRSGSKYSATKAKTAREHFACAMLEELGAYNIADNAPVLLDGLSIEEILLENPDYIFISTMGDEAAARAYMDGVLEGEAWQRLDAVKNGRCIYLPKELFHYKPNARWAQAYACLSDLLYPDEE